MKINTLPVLNFYQSYRLFIIGGFNPDKGEPTCKLYVSGSRYFSQ